MGSYEEYLKNLLCYNCHISILKTHPEESKANQGYFKCKTCGFTKLINERKRKSDIIKK